MANKVQLKAAGDRDFTDNYPFAELTRIMGFDPRVQPTPRPDEDFEIDLEKELMGMFDPGPDAPIGPAPTQGYPQETDDNLRANDATSAEALEEVFAANLEEELSARADSWDGAEEGASPAGESAAEQTVMRAEADPAHDGDPEGVFDDLAEVDMDFGASSGQAGEEYEGDDRAAEEHAGDETVEASAFEDRNTYRPVSFTPGHASHAAPEQADGEGDAERAAAPVFNIRSYKSAAQQYREARHVQEVAPSSEARAEAPLEEQAQRAKGVDPFDILAALGTERGLPQRRDPLKAKPDTSAELPEEPAAPAPQGEPEIQASKPADGTAYLVADERPFEAEVARAEPETVEREADDVAAEAVPFLDIRPVAPTEYVAADDAGETSGEPVSGPEPATPEIETTEIEEPAIAIADDLDIPVPAFLTEARPAPVFDELDEEFEQAFQALSRQGDAIRQAAAAPEEPSRAQTSTDIEQLFAEELGIGSAAASTVLANAAAGTEKENAGNRLDAFEFDDADFLPEEFAEEARRELGAAFAAEDAGAGNRAGWPTGLPQGRGKLVAVALAGVVVLGGIGVFALSGSGGATGDKPLVLKADAHPVKVKPKNPGGMTVPNQDNKVYERVADGATAVAPEQKKLVSSEEQPVDISAEAKNAASALPGVFEGDQITPVDDDPAVGNDTAAAVSPAAAPKEDIANLIKAAPKGEDRLTPSQSAASGRNDSDILTVTPHKVKTMIVRADGTMVPREEPVSAEPASVSASQAAAEKAEAATSTNLPSAAPIPTHDPQAQPAVTAAKAPQPAAPKTFERADRGQISNAAEVARAPSRPAEQPVAATPQKVASAEPAPAPAPVAEASGDWSVQIASQPTAEAAQKSYQNMARRYASVLGGHAANIVKADIAGKGTYYRVRIAANSKEDAIALCTKYKAAGGSCFVSK
jgi:hypothetical protein